MFPGHLLFRVVQVEPELKLAVFDYDWLQNYLDKHPNSLAHHREDKSIVLTASRWSHDANAHSPRNVDSLRHARTKTSCISSVASEVSPAFNRRQSA